MLGLEQSNGLQNRKIVTVSRMFARDGCRLRSKAGGRREFTTKSTKDTKNGSEVKTGSLMNFNLCGLGFPQFAANIVIPAHAGIQWFVRGHRPSPV